MTLIGLCSAHGSPGVTTAALALGAAWPEDREAVMVEADPYGGVVAARFGLGDSPGLASLVAAARPGLTSEALMRHVQRLPGGMPVVVGVTSPEQGYGVIRDVTIPLADVAAAGEVDVIVDAGRVAPGSRTLELLWRCDLALVVVRPSLDQLRHAAQRVRALSGHSVAVSLVLVGEAPYHREEVAESLGVDVAGVLAWDPEAASAMDGTALHRMNGSWWGGLRRSMLARSAAGVVEDIVSRVDSPTERASVTGGAA